MIAPRRILLVDDHAVVREGIKRLLERHEDFIVVGECQDGAEALTEIARLNPDVVLMDLSMPNLSGIEATRIAKRLHPHVRLIALTVHEDEAYVLELLKAGACGYLFKRAPGDEIARAVRVVAEGGTYFDPALTSPRTETEGPGAIEPDQELNERETEVLRAVALGYSNKEIGAQLDLSVKTIETAKIRAMEKLGLKSRAEIMRLARVRGWLMT